MVNVTVTGILVQCAMTCVYVCICVCEGMCLMVVWKEKDNGKEVEMSVHEE